MNSIFSAQKLGVLIDAMIVSKFDSHILQQACFLTGGLYFKHMDERDTLQMLCTYFLADSSVREMFNQPVQKSVDFKASCFCHKTPVEYAFMCSVCLTLLCNEVDVCPVCSTPMRSKKR
jgi:transcription initiation factor TFIIH subunit 3